jgi:two-component system OmpR family response regulator
MKILIVDDNQDITELVSKFLTAKGFENVATNDPRNGLERIIKERYDVVLLDIAMPEFCGRDIIEALENKNILKDQKS